MQNDKQINEEYKIWKKNTPFLYDLVMTYALEWPSLTIQWLPQVTKVESSNSNNHKIIIGTHAVEEQNFLMLANVFLPETNVTIDSSMENGDKEYYGGFGKASGKFDIDIRICHDGEVNRARYMPQNPCVIATKSPNPEVFIFDYTRHPNKPDLKKGCQPDIKLVGHKKEGYGLSWNPQTEGRILSSSDDGTICYWNINGAPSSQQTINCLSMYDGNVVVEDVTWHSFHPDIFASVSDDGRIMIWDIREPTKRPSHNVVGHSGEIYCISMSPFSENIFATGASDKVIKLWDIRYMSKGSVHQLNSHKSEVIQIEWSPHRETMLASCSTDRRVNIWDLSRTGIDPSQEDLLDGPAELIFVHGGHTSKVSDISWNINEPLLIGSVSDDNIIQFWKMIYGVENEDVECAPMSVKNPQQESSIKHTDPPPVVDSTDSSTAADPYAHPQKVPKV